MNHDRAIELIDAARVELNTYLDVEIATIEKCLCDLLRERAMPVVVPGREIERLVGKFLENMSCWDANHVVPMNGRFHVGFRDGDEDGGDYMSVDYRSPFATREHCERYLLAGELTFWLEDMAEQVAPDMTYPEYGEFLNRLGHGDLMAYREARVGRVERSAA